MGAMLWAAVVVVNACWLLVVFVLFAGYRGFGVWRGKFCGRVDFWFFASLRLVYPCFNLPYFPLQNIVVRTVATIKKETAMSDGNSGTEGEGSMVRLGEGVGVEVVVGLGETVTDGEGVTKTMLDIGFIKG